MPCVCVCVCARGRGYDQEVDPDDTYASTPSPITLKLLLALAVAHGRRVHSMPPCPSHGVLSYGLKRFLRMCRQHFASVKAALVLERWKSVAQN